MDITKAVVVLGIGTDKVCLDTDLPSPLPKVTDAPLMLTFDAEHGTGVEYVKNIFGIEPEVIKTQ